MLFLLSFYLNPIPLFLPPRLFILHTHTHFSFGFFRSPVHGCSAAKQAYVCTACCLRRRRWWLVLDANSAPAAEQPPLCCRFAAGFARLGRDYYWTPLLGWFTLPPTNGFWFLLPAVTTSPPHALPCRAWLLPLLRCCFAPRFFLRAVFPAPADLRSSLVPYYLLLLPAGFRLCLPAFCCCARPPPCFCYTARAPAPAARCAFCTRCICLLRGLAPYLPAVFNLLLPPAAAVCVLLPVSAAGCCLPLPACCGLRRGTPALFICLFVQHTHTPQRFGCFIIFILGIEQTACHFIYFYLFVQDCFLSAILCPLSLINQSVSICLT